MVRYDKSLPAAQRRKQGSHFTPIHLASALARYTLAPHLDLWSYPYPPEITICDPACGDGALLAAARAYVLSRQPRAEVHLIGFDLDPGAIATARTRLPPEADLRCADFLRESTFDEDVTAWVLNPPFLGGRKISTNLGTEYRDFLKKRFAGWHGNADLSAAFLRKVDEHMTRTYQETGQAVTAGAITTSTISEGDTRRAGLARMVADGAELYQAVRSMKWPGDAKLQIAVVHWSRGELRFVSKPVFSGTSNPYSGTEK